VLPHAHTFRACGFILARVSALALLLCCCSYGSAIEVDYRGYDVTVENFLRVLTGARPLLMLLHVPCVRALRCALTLHRVCPTTGRHEAWVPRSKRLLSDARSNVLVYMTGHGGDEFLKFQDQARRP
jgi:phosphatidylinositol glycan class K